MAVDPDGAFSRGDIMRRLADLEGQVRALQTARRLEAARIGDGGITVRGGAIIIQDANGVETMRLSTDGLSLTGLLQVLGTIEVTGNSIIVLDQDGSEIFRAGSGGLTLRGALDVLGGGGITARGGTILAEDTTGSDIFRVTTDPASIFMRQELIRDLSLAILADRLHSESIPLSGGSVSNPGSTYVASGGPTLTNVDVSATGALILLLTSRIACQINQPLGVSASGWMSFRITGSTVVEPDDENSVHNDLFGPAADVIATTIGASRLVLVEGLNPGLHTIAARYRSVGVDPVPQHAVTFTSRNLTALAL